MKEAIKATNKDTEIITWINESRPILSDLVKTSEKSPAVIRDTAKLIKELGQSTNGPIWELCFNLALVYDLVNNDGSANPDSIIQKYTNFYDFIYKNGLENIYDLKTLLDGNQVRSEFQIKTGGPIIKQILDNIFIWQVDNPGKTKEDLIEEIKNNPDKFTK